VGNSQVYIQSFDQDINAGTELSSSFQVDIPDHQSSTNIRVEVTSGQDVNNSNNSIENSVNLIVPVDISGSIDDAFEYPNPFDVWSGGFGDYLDIEVNNSQPYEDYFIEHDLYIDGIKVDNDYDNTQIGAESILWYFYYFDLNSNEVSGGEHEIKLKLKVKGGQYQVRDINTSNNETNSVTLNFKEEVADQPVLMLKNSKADAETTNEIQSSRIYPNPVESLLFIQSNSDAGFYKIFNSIGQLIKEDSMDKGKQSIRVDQLTEGVYTIYIGSDRHKFIKQ